MHHKSHTVTEIHWHRAIPLNYFPYLHFIDKLYRQHGIHRDPSYELRTVCLTAIQMALETKRPKFVAIALNGMHVSLLSIKF